MPRIRQYEKIPEKKSHKQSKRVILIVLLLIIIYFIVKIWTGFITNAPNPTMKNLCNIQSGHCKVLLTGNDKSVELRVTPTPIRAGKKLNFEVTVHGINPSSVFVSIAPMKGLANIRDKDIQLRQIGTTTYGISTKLSSKLTQETDWIVLVRVLGGQEDVAIPFTFTSAARARTLMESLQKSDQ